MLVSSPYAGVHRADVSTGDLQLGASVCPRTRGFTWRPSGAGTKALARVFPVRGGSPVIANAGCRMYRTQGVSFPPYAGVHNRIMPADRPRFRYGLVSSPYAGGSPTGWSRRQPRSALVSSAYAGVHRIMFAL